jgi:hypothetical protein
VWLAGQLQLVTTAGSCWQLQLTFRSTTFSTSVATRITEPQGIFCTAEGSAPQRDGIRTAATPQATAGPPMLLHAQAPFYGEDTRPPLHPRQFPLHKHRTAAGAAAAIMGCCAALRVEKRWRCKRAPSTRVRAVPPVPANTRCPSSPSPYRRLRPLHCLCVNHSARAPPHRGGRCRLTRL